MAKGPSAPPPPKPPFSLRSLLFVAALLICLREGYAGCRYEHCSRLYAYAVEEHRAQKGSALAYCSVLRSYSTCLRGTARTCRGYLPFHSMLSLVVQWMANNNCSQTGPTHTPSTTTAAPLHHHHHHHHHRSSMCEFKGDEKHRYCALFGDPHLRTFDGRFQTCRVAGAWPLIDSKHLAVQVTNEPVAAGATATYTTKVTVIFKSSGKCASEKTYEAQSDSPLPPTFIDGSQTSGVDHAVRIVQHRPGAHVELQAHHLGATLVLHHTGRLLTFAARVPNSQVATSGLQLCSNGCPASERLTGLTTMAATEQCRSYNLTGPYLEGCAFDLSATGDEEFMAAAIMAQSDAWTLGAGALNGTQEGTKKAGTSSTPSLRAGVLSFFTVFLFIGR